MVLFHVLAVEKGCWRSSVLIAFESRIQLQSTEWISTTRSLMVACSFQKSTTKSKANLLCAIAPIVTLLVGLRMEYTLNGLPTMSLLGTKCSPSYKHSFWKSCSQRSCLHNQTTQATRRTLHPTEPKVMCKGEKGRMIACDNPLCPYEWFHFRCVSLTT